MTFILFMSVYFIMVVFTYLISYALCYNAALKKGYSRHTWVKSGKSDSITTGLLLGAIWPVVIPAFIIGQLYTLVTERWGLLLRIERFVERKRKERECLY